MKAALDRWPAVGGYLDEESLNPPAVLAWRPRATPGELPCPFGLLPAPIGANCGVWRDAYEAVGGFDLSFRGAAAEETDLFWRLQLAGYQLGYAPDAVVAYRHRPDLRSLLRQWRGYGRGRAHLVARYQELGLLPAESWQDAVRTSVWLAAHAVDCVRGPGPSRELPAHPGPCGGPGGGQPGIWGAARPPRQPATRDGAAGRPVPRATSSGPRPASPRLRTASARRLDRGPSRQCSTRAAARRVPSSSRRTCAAGPAVS